MKLTRRESFLKAATLAGCALAVSGSAADSVGRYPRNPTKADIDRWMKELSNWGRWGKDDQAGTINLITPAKRKAAAAVVHQGHTHGVETKLISGESNCDLLIAHLKRVRI